MMRWLALFTMSVLIGGCTGANTVECGNGSVCPAGSECAQDRGFDVCIPQGCGNGTVDPGEDCDDGNTTSGDGCQATCRVTGSPTRRYGVAMAYDVLHRTIVAFGGVDVTTYDDTWLWDGSVWTRHNLSMPNPPARSGAAITYDAERDRVVMFGGYGAANQPLDDLWEWDSSGWRQIDQGVSPRPTARGRASMAYDRTRQVAVLFGGGDAPSPANPYGLATDRATWEWDGNRWSQISPSDAPSARFSPGMTFDSTRDEILLVGGEDDGNTWTWNGTRWARLPLPRAPTQFRGAGLAFDQARLHPVLYGGLDYPGSNMFGDTWELEPGGWVRQGATPSPPPRTAFGMTFVDDSEAVIVFGGYGVGGIRLDDTWSWDGQSWNEWR